MSTLTNDNHTMTQNRPMREHADAIRDDLQSLSSDTSQAVSAAANVANEKIQEQAEKITEMAKSGGERAKDCHAKVCDRVSKHPTAAVLVTLGVGIVVGRLLGR